MKIPIAAGNVAFHMIQWFQKTFVLTAGKGLKRYNPKKSIKIIIKIMIVTTDNKIYTENSIRTYTGKVFDLKILDPESICIEDIAHALANTARFGGHLNKFYSVAQHSVHIAERVMKEFRLDALLHDASEAYLGDMPSPFKKMLPEFKLNEDRVMNVIAEKFGFDYPLNDQVKFYDKILLQMEWDSFVEIKYPTKLEAWSPDFSEWRFLKMWEQIKAER